MLLCNLCQLVCPLAVLPDLKFFPSVEWIRLARVVQDRFLC
jgi:hypothetical protein